MLIRDPANPRPAWTVYLAQILTKGCDWLISSPAATQPSSAEEAFVTQANRRGPIPTFPTRVAGLSATEVQPRMTILISSEATIRRYSAQLFPRPLSR